MIITANSPEVAVLMQIWNSVDRRTEGLAEGLKQRLVRDVLAPALLEFEGQLVLKYQEFLSSSPSGNHSFVHGSEMISKTVRWVSVARIAPGEVEEVPEEHHPSPKGKFTLVTSSKVLVPVIWGVYLEPRYRRGVDQPHFVIGQRRSEEGNENVFDLSLLGHHLFRVRRSNLDWATKIEIAVGNESVGTWLRKWKSAQTFNMLMRG